MAELLGNLIILCFLIIAFQKVFGISSVANQGARSVLKSVDDSLMLSQERKDRKRNSRDYLSPEELINLSSILWEENSTEKLQKIGMTKTELESLVRKLLKEMPR